MNIMMADVTDLPDAEISDEAVLIGGRGDDRIEVEELAMLNETINYEFQARLSPEIPRVVV